MTLSLTNEIAEFNRQFDYGEYHEDPEFWLAMIRYQTDEMEKAIEDGDLDHYVHEAADAVLVAHQIMEQFGTDPSRHIRYRMQKAEDKGIQNNIVPKYLSMYESGMAPTRYWPEDEYGNPPETAMITPSGELYHIEGHGHTHKED